MAPSVQLPRELPRLCPQCGQQLDLKSPHIEILRSKVRVFCSQECRRRALAGPVAMPPPPLPPARPSPLRSVRVRAALVGLVIALLLLGGDGRGPLLAGDRGLDVLAAGSRLATWSPEPESDEEADEAAAAEAAWTAALSNDRWVHPLAGPQRRMPIRLSRVFGAQRPGHRPMECNAGHCGVDIGGEVWGEPILAAHGGIVDRVQRDPDRGRGGMYVRLSHRDGTVFTQYFHLAAIPGHLREGTPVRAGEVIGLLGATGIKHSEAHLHFTVAVKSSEEGPEQYIDPEPLIALWPVAVPVFGDVASIARTHVVPGHPRGPYGQRARKPKRRRAPPANAEPSTEPAEPEPAARTAKTGAGPAPTRARAGEAARAD
jgi:murein DD-endopeptidase MepM/ murein hydrolase activator NlpD